MDEKESLLSFFRTFDKAAGMRKKPREAQKLRRMNMAALTNRNLLDTWFCWCYYHFNARKD